MPDSPLQILFAGHEATRTGAPIGFLSLMHWLKDHDQLRPTVWLRHGGITVGDHRSLGPVIVGARDLDGAAAGPFHLAYLNTATLGSFAAALNAAGLPVVCHAHEMDFELHATGEANLRLLRANVARYIACSEAVRNDLIRVLGIDAEKITVVPECVDVDRALRQAQEPVPDAMQQWRLRNGINRIVCGMGTVSWRKGVDLFLQTVARLRSDDGGESWGGLWIGDLESGPQADVIKHDLRVLGLQDQVLFSGSQANPHAWLKSADVFALTSREDPYPLAMVEAAALGKGVVGFRGSGGVEEFVREAGGHLVAYGDAAAMAEACRGAAREKSGEGAAAARRLCQPDVVGAAVAKVIREIALPEAIPLGVETIDRLRLACQQATVFRVTLHQEGNDGNVVCEESWEGPANGPAEAELLLPGDVDWETGKWVLTLHALGRSVIARLPRVDVLRGAAAERLDGLRFRSGGSAVHVEAFGFNEWLMLDGRGRLSVRLSGDQLRGADAVLLRWEVSAEIKEALRDLCGAAGEPLPPAAPRVPIWLKLSRYLFGN